MTNRFWSMLSLCVFSLLAIIPAVRAEAPPVRSQVPGYYRMQLGRFEITALYDGATQIDTSLLKHINPAELQEMLSRMFVASPKMQTAVNAYLLNTDEHLVLVDSGMGVGRNPALGNVVANLKAAGYAPGQVDTVVITHLHPDHMGGLNDGNGQPFFPKARILVAQEESDYWLSEKKAAEAPPEKQSRFKMVRDMAAPYQASGRWQTFTAGSTLVPGIQPTAAHGHTPGHTAFAVESAGQQLLIWGDVVHAHAVQFARPGVSIEFDTDQQQAIATRRSLMQAMAESKTLVAGMHLSFPGIGHVRADGQDSYSWVPVEFAPLPKATE